ncbi:DUF5602 domain-containing protein [Rhodococcus maanshanensis]|uniref:TTHB210-like domain-containing protein n=1 Tax=Rhodococcus maanshanensis TaxID=183556 RepID=A0A1H7WS24_9NOCA|nr:DUF5602 domain-containing protein [Rhodococcus maanshanensis]SEM24174.1 hypothetical protein SAMN05444583_12851 [Rhodococcus maanshanensis]
MPNTELCTQPTTAADLAARPAKRAARLALAACAAVTLAGCGAAVGADDRSGTFFGPSQDLGDGTSKTYVSLDSDGKPTEIGIRITETALDGLPGGPDAKPQMLMFDLPDEASETVFEHVMLDWNPNGHDPQILWGKPHFDMHFYLTDMAEVHAIDPTAPDFATKAARLPDPKYIPQDYVAPPGPPAANTVPSMGLHWNDSADRVVPGSFDFTEVLLNGSWDGEFTFIEPMMTREWLLTKPTLQEDLKLPKAYPRSGYSPTTYTVRFDDRSAEYVITLEGMTMREKS